MGSRWYTELGSVKSNVLFTTEESDSSSHFLKNICMHTCDSSTILRSFNHYDYLRIYSLDSKNYLFRQNSFVQKFDLGSEEPVKPWFANVFYYFFPISLCLYFIFLLEWQYYSEKGKTIVFSFPTMQNLS